MERLLGAEGSGPGLANVRAWHCAGCAHDRADRWLATGAGGVAAVVIGLIAVAVSPGPGMTLVVIGAAVACWCYVRVRRRFARLSAGLPVPLHPKVSDVRVLERLGTTITLGADGSDYRVETGPVRGEIRAVFTFDSRDRERVRAARRDREARYMAGCLVPQGRTGAAELSTSPVIKVDGDVRDVPVLGSEDSPASFPRPLDLGYDLLIPPEIDGGPVWITPSIVPESDRRVLELDIQWPEIGPADGEPLALDSIRSLKVTVPVGWGKIQNVSRGRALVWQPAAAEAAENGPVTHTVEWPNLLPEDAEKEAHRLTLKIEFEERIPSQGEVTGHLSATMKGSLSGISGLRMYNALGQYRAVSGKISVRTQLDADFTLSLAGIRYQSVKTFPDRAGRDHHHGDDVIESGAIPDDDTLIALTNALGEEDFYVKRIVENPPRAGGKSDVRHRSWDIAGRSYTGVYPVDFHLAVAGDEIHEGDVRPVSGSTRVQISVQGAYTDEEMRSRIENVWERLRRLVRKVLEENRR